MKQLSEEKDKAILDGWKEEARQVKTPEQLAAFVKKLTTEYRHDYGTICHAVHAAMKAALRVVDAAPQGGITGFQASCIGWMLIDDMFMCAADAPKALVQYENMLYPQYADSFGSISSDTWKWLQDAAKKKLAEIETNSAHPNIVAHWKSVAGGNVPFGFRVRSEGH
jgi:hypothetical protein